MKFINYFLLIILLILTNSISSYAQGDLEHDDIQKEKYTLSGYLRDGETGEALIGSRVYIDTLKTGSISNEYGFYSITLSSGTYEILFSFIGKKTQKKRVELSTDIELDINLKTAELLNTVTVTADRKDQKTAEIGTIELSMSKVKSLPVLLGERDIIKTAQLLPGIQSGSEGSSGIYVRGGGPDQNLILLDGVPIYNANHLFGFFSVFNADAINNVKLVKGGFPAEYGGRLSSVIDIRMNEGDMKKIHGEGSVGIISSKLMINGPIIKDKTSFMISGRRTYIDVLARPIIALVNKNKSDDKIQGGYFFYDINAKINHKFNKNNQLYFSTYFGDDKFKIKEQSRYIDPSDNLTHYNKTESGLQWGNKIMALRWNHKFGPKLFANTTLNYSSYNLKNGFSNKNFTEGKEKMPDTNAALEYTSGIQDWGGNLNFYYYPAPKHSVKFGIGETYQTFKPGVNLLTIQSETTDTDSTYGSTHTYAHEFYGYLQDDFKIGNRLSANMGVHFSNFCVRNKHYYSLQPRAALNFQLDEHSSLKASYSKTAQFLHLLTNTSVGLPTDLWVPATDSVPPQYGHQISIGYTRELKRGYKISAEAYYKTMDNLLEYKDGASFFGTDKNWEQLIEIGHGRSYGGEILLEKRMGKTTGWVGYTLSWANRQFKNINDGDWFPYRYDRRHDFSIVLTHKFNDKIDIGIVWVYGTGNSVTLAQQKYTSLEEHDFGPSEVEHVEGRNNYRVPSYHRLDLGVNIHKEKKWGKATWSFGLYNAYSRKNPFYIEYGYSKNSYSDKKTLRLISLFPIIPSISYSFKF